jgi:hypothetical protein
MKTMITIASKQIWPQVLCVSHIRPEHIILLHSNDEQESSIPARRLNKFGSSLFSVE